MLKPKKNLRGNKKSYTFASVYEMEHTTAAAEMAQQDTL